VHLKAMLIAAFGPFFEAFDQQNIIYVLPALLVPFGLSATEAGFIAASGLYGMALGCLIAGPLADRLGRKRMFQYFLIWFAVWTGVCALAWDLTSLATMRFILGVGLGGELPVGVALMSELLPRSGRRLLPVYQSFFGLGQLAAAGVALVLVPSSPQGWRLVFVVGLAPLLLGAVLRRRLPESARWLAYKGRLEEARRAVDALRGGSTSRRLETSADAAAELTWSQAPTSAGCDLFRGTWARRTLVNVVYWLVSWLAAGAFALLYVYLASQGFSLQSTLTFGLISTLASVPGYWVSAYLIERVGRKPTLAAYALVGAAGYWAVVRTADPGAVAASLLVINFSTIGAIGAAYTYLAEQYPTAIRATATAWVNVVARLALASGAVLVGALTDRIGPQNAFTVSAVLFVLAGLVVMLFGIETRGKSLEQIEALT
jgi:putative MFS transporter